LVIEIRPPGLHDVAPGAAQRPGHNHEVFVSMADRQETPLAMESLRVLAFEHRIVEHAGGAHEIHAEFSEILLAARLFPLEHAGYLAAGLPQGKPRPQAS
jgi:hypothetical protein